MKRVLLIATLLILSAGVSFGQRGSVIIKYTGFTVKYNPNTRQLDWVDYTLTSKQVDLSNNTPKVSRYFMPDPKLSLPQAAPADYNKSGWVRGHMARRQNMKWSEQAIKGERLLAHCQRARLHSRRGGSDV